VLDTIPESQLTTPRKAAVMLAMVLAIFAALLAIAVALPHDRYIRFQQFASGDLSRLRWVYERIHFDPTPIDVAVIGSSRVEAAISASRLERALSTELDRTIRVANLAVPQEGRDLHYVIARELFIKHPETRLVILSLAEPVRRSHPAFRNVADTSEILGSPRLLNFYWLDNVAFLPYRNLSLFAQSLLPSFFGVRDGFDPRSYAGTEFDTTTRFQLDNGRIVDRETFADIEGMEREANERKPAGSAQNRLSRLSGLSDNVVEEYFTSRLANELRQRCGGLVLVHTPVYRGSPNDVDVATNQQWAPVLMTPPWIGDAPTDYSDAVHLRRSGIDKVSAWLPEALRPYLEPLRHPQACGQTGSP
jgi:hypothetical protein